MVSSYFKSFFVDQQSFSNSYKKIITPPSSSIPHELVMADRVDAVKFLAWKSLKLSLSALGLSTLSQTYSPNVSSDFVRSVAQVASCVSLVSLPVLFVSKMVSLPLDKRAKNTLEYFKSNECVDTEPTYSMQMRIKHYNESKTHIDENKMPTEVVLADRVNVIHDHLVTSLCLAILSLPVTAYLTERNESSTSDFPWSFRVILGGSIVILLYKRSISGVNQRAKKIVSD